MLRLMASFFAVALLTTQVAMAEETQGDDFAQYSLNVGVSPFGGSLNFGYNDSPKTTYLFAMGGLPETEMDLKVGDVDYTVASKSAWVGAFINHRPCASATWFRVVAGIGIGNIENELTDADGNIYRANYRENPVGYVGVGFGAQAVKGFAIGLDIGLLHTAGPDISPAGGTPTPEAMEAIADDLFFGSVLPNAQLTLGWGF